MCCVTPIFLNIGWIVRLVADSHRVADGAVVFLDFYVPGIAAYFVQIHLFYAAIIHGASWMLVLLEGSSFIVSTLMNYVFMFPLHMGLFGSSLSTSLGMFVKCTIYAGYLFTGSRKQAIWFGWTSSAWLNWKEYVVCSLSGVGTCLPIWLVIDAFVLLTSLLGEDQLAAQVLTSQVVYLVYKVPYALGKASTARIGNISRRRKSRRSLYVCTRHSLSVHG